MMCHRSFTPLNRFALRTWQQYGRQSSTLLYLALMAAIPIALPLPSIAQVDQVDQSESSQTPFPVVPPARSQTPEAPRPSLIPGEWNPYLPQNSDPIVNEAGVETAYVLGSGDTIQVDIFDVPEFSGQQYQILVDGTITLPWIGRTSLQGLTLEQASVFLEQQYAPFLTMPVIEVSLIQARALRIAIVGEVRRPGSYTINPFAGATTELAAGVGQWTTAVQAIQQAGGITELADVRNIEIRRSQYGQEDIVIEIDLWELLQTGELEEDITLRDGDTVFVPELTAINPEEVADLAISNIAPLTIRTYVVGEVENPGLQELPPNTTVNQAILAAGTFNNDRVGRVDLIRLNPDGSVEKRRVPVDLEDPLNEETNPVLRNNDILVVRRSGLARVTDFIGVITEPIRDVLGILDTFDIFQTDGLTDEEERVRELELEQQRRELEDQLNQ